LIKIVLADDQILFVESLRSVLETRAKDIKVVGIAHNGRETIEYVEKNRPDIVLMDVRMPEIDGVEATRIIHSNYPQTQVIMLTTFDDDEYVYEALRYGAAGYLLKDISPKELITAIHVIKEGIFIIAPTVAQRIVQSLKLTKETLVQSMESTNTAPWLKNLNRREIEILKLIAKGYDNKKIAEQLFLAEQTVKNYVSSIYSKLGAHDRMEAMKMAIKAKLSN